MLINQRRFRSYQCIQARFVCSVDILLIILLVLPSFVNSLAVSSKESSFLFCSLYIQLIFCCCCKQRNVLYFVFFEEILAEVERVLKTGIKRSREPAILIEDDLMMSPGGLLTNKTYQFFLLFYTFKALWYFLNLAIVHLVYLVCLLGTVKFNLVSVLYFRASQN